MANDKSTFQLLLEELLKIYRPLMDDLSGILERMDAGGSIPQNALDDLQAKVNDLPALTDLTSAAAIDDARQKIIALYNAIKGLDAGEAAADIGNFSRRLNDYLIADYLRVHRTTFYHLASLLGWIRFSLNDEHAFDTDPPIYGETPMAWDSLPAFFTDPSAEFSKAGHGWGKSAPPEEAFQKQYPFLFYHLGKLLDRSHENTGFPIAATTFDHDPPDNSTLYIPVTSETAGFRLSRLDDNGIAARPEASLQRNVDIALTAMITLLLEAEIALTGGFVIEISPDGVALSPEAPQVQARIMTGLRVSKTDRILLLGTADGNRVDLKSVAAKVGLRVATGERMEFLGELTLTEGRIVIKKAGGDGFLNSLLPKDGIVAQFDVKVGWSNLQGVYFDGSAGLEIKIPAHIELGPIEIHGISLGILPQTGGDLPGFDLPVGADVQLLLGPFTAIVQDMGIRTFFSYNEGGGILGPFDLDVDFKPPKGLGLSLQTPTIRGGGYLFFDFDKGEYAGVAELVIKELVAVKAIGIINTKKPDGSPGFSFLLIITAEFQPIQLGFGFTLNGVGGLIAINRGMNLEALAAGVRTNAINAVMFPDDPVAEAPRIIADLNQFFPIAEGRYTFGLMAIIGWGTPTLIEVEMGLIIQVPDPVILAIVGVVRVQLPDKAAPILSLQVNFIGAVDFEEGYMFFFAALFESRLVQYRIEGEMYFTVSWGDRPNFLFTVGGFHPAFRPPALPNLSGSLKRITINLLPTDNPRLTVQAYFAVTSNTVQFGASVDFYFKVSKFKVVGYLYLDALFQFNPFFFIVEIGAGLSVMLGGSELLGIHLRGSLSGPTPWHIKGSASFRILFIKVKVRVSKRFGREKKQILPPRPMLPLLLEVLRDVRNWQSALPRFTELQVTLAEIPEEELVLHPAGVLSINQNRIPLNFRFEKVGNERTSDYQAFNFSIDQYSEADQLRDFFAPAEYLLLSDSQRLSRNSFERMPSGRTAKGGDAFSSADYVGRDYEFEQLILDGPDFFARRPAEADRIQLDQSDYEAFAKGNAVARSPQGRRNALKPAADKPVQRREAQYGIVERADLTIVEMNDKSLLYGSQAEAVQVLRAIENAKPQLSRRFQVVPAYEIQDL